MDKEGSQQKEELRKKKLAFEEIRDKFNKWRFNMYLCTGLYVLIFVIAQKVNEYLKNCPRLPKAKTKTKIQYSLS